MHLGAVRPRSQARADEGPGPGKPGEPPGALAASGQEHHTPALPTALRAELCVHSENTPASACLHISKAAQSYLLGCSPWGTAAAFPPCTLQVGRCTAGKDLRPLDTGTQEESGSGRRGDQVSLEWYVMRKHYANGGAHRSSAGTHHLPSSLVDVLLTAHSSAGWACWPQTPVVTGSVGADVAGVSTLLV